MQTYTVPQIQNGPATADTFNAPLNYIQDALNDISGQIQLNTNKQAVLQWQAPIAANVTAGDLVYWNSANARFEKALASTTIGLSGRRIRAESSLVQGLILSVNATQMSAVLLRYGYFKDKTVIETALGVGASSGLYYLSSSTAGKAVNNPTGNLIIPCINNYGEGQFAVLPVDQGVQLIESDSIVRSIESVTLDVTTGTRGRVNIEVRPKTRVSAANASTAVSDFSNSTIYYTSVVSGLIGGPGMDVMPVSDSGSLSGYWKVNTSVQQHHLPAQDVYLDGTQLANDGIYTCILFPGTADGPRAVVQKCLPYYSSQKPFNGSLAVWAYCTSGSGTCNVSVKWLPFAAGGSEMDLGSTSISMSAGLKTSGSISVNLISQGMLVAVITKNAGSTSDIYCNKFGFYLTGGSN